MKLRTLSSVHRIVGFTITFFLIVLCLTGILLLHTDELQLQERFTDNEILLDWYGVSPRSAPRVFQLDDSWVTQVDAKLYLDTTPLPENSEVLQGAVSLGGFIVLAFDNSLFLLTREGDLVERQDSLQGAPSGIEAIAAMPPDKFAVQTSEGILTSDIDLVSWQKEQGINAAWSNMVEPPQDLLELILQQYRGAGLPVERVILDLHSGRILGSFGVFLVDIIVVVLLIATVSGWWSWLKRRAIQKELDIEE